MPKRSKLLAALDSHKGKNYRLEKQKALRKAAAKKKALKQAPQSSADEGQIDGGTAHSEGGDEWPTESEGWESDNDVDEANAVCTQTGCAFLFMIHQTKTKLYRPSFQL